LSSPLRDATARRPRQLGHFWTRQYVTLGHRLAGPTTWRSIPGLWIRQPPLASSALRLFVSCTFVTHFHCPHASLRTPCPNAKHRDASQGTCHQEPTPVRTLIVHYTSRHNFGKLSGRVWPPSLIWYDSYGNLNSEMAARSLHISPSGRASQTTIHLTTSRSPSRPRLLVHFLLPSSISLPFLTAIVEPVQTQCNAAAVTHIPNQWLATHDMPPHMPPARPSVPLQIQTRTGPRYQIWLNGVVSRIELLRSVISACHQR
jgi:hypothetical protein